MPNLRRVRAVGAKLVFDAARGVTPRGIRRLLPRSLKWWLRLKGLGYTPYDFERQTFNPDADPKDLYYCYRLLLGRLPDPAGWRDYQATMQSRPFPVASLVSDFLGSVEFQRGLQTKRAAPAEAILADLGEFRLYVLPADADVSAVILGEGTYEPHVGNALRSYLKPGATFVDVGANIGFFSMLGASLVGPSGRVVAIEPGQAACALIAASAMLNGFGHVEVWPIAVAEARQVCGLTGAGSHSTLIERDAVTPAGGWTSLVLALTLDELLADASRVDFIKLDLEGAEGRALEGARHTLARHRPMLVTEFSPAALGNISRLSGEGFLALLSGLGYEVAVLDYKRGTSAWGLGYPAIVRALERHAAQRLDLIGRPR